MCLLSWFETLRPPMHFYLTDILLRMPLYLVKTNQVSWFMVQLPNACEFVTMRHDEKVSLRAFRRQNPRHDKLASLKNLTKRNGSLRALRFKYVRLRENKIKKGGFRLPMLDNSVTEIIIYKCCVLGMFHLFL